jgi:hypothetical protein
MSAPKEIGVLLKGPLVRKFLAGEKTVTRRADLAKWRKAKPRDLIWFRETCCNIALNGYRPVYIYRADGDDKPPYLKWIPSIHMPKAAARCWAEIEDIREERLQDISEEDARAEGVAPIELPDGVRSVPVCCGRTLPSGECCGDPEPYPEQCYMPSFVAGFAEIWNSINGKKPGLSWYDNPTVARIQFRRIER